MMMMMMMMMMMIGMKSYGYTVKPDTGPQPIRAPAGTSLRTLPGGDFWRDQALKFGEYMTILKELQGPQ